MTGNQKKKSKEPKARHRTDGKSMYFGQYVSYEGSFRLHNYEYHGADHSIIYKHLLTPMNEFLLQYIPLWVAPNVITLAGLILVSITHCFMIYYCPFLEREAPTWVYVAAALALFAYQTLDNLDGKQARRTGTSSPLGLLFDHGCDAINVTVGCCTMACVMQFGPTWKSLIMSIAGNMTFICATWEEYYTGSLNLPAINGPTEGILIAISLKLLTAALGPEIWLEQWIPGVYNNTLFLIFAVCSSICTICSNSLNVWQTIRKHEGNMFVAITRLFPFILLNGLAFGWALYSPLDIFQRHPRIFLWTLGMLNSKLVLHLMLAHLCGEEYHPFRKTLVPIFYVAAHWGFCAYQGIISDFNEIVVLNEFFFITLVAYVHLVISVIREVSKVLNVRIFTIASIKSKTR